MPSITVRIYRSDGAKGTRTLMRTLRVETQSTKALTGRRATALLRREVAGFKTGSVIAMPRGWRATRSLRATGTCGYHYVWEEVEIVQDE